ncbi:Spy/CpxP family protein refolding chaperone [Sanyastnella coralliicola]|uniref:Spy/CpxP family protein refolding chaperone n=1 Tax=Sanyastnella coralliicola TaxID=3069118 RepID=UPI0027B95B5E|nr:Spy/CpxP family protein refolding chaperone [Longitalea sp. SCSIO 12813]
MKFEMKHFILTACMVFTLGISAWAQPGPGGEKIEQLRIAFITEELDLTSEEAQQFWPIFNEFNDKKKEGHEQVRKTNREISKKENPTEADLRRLVNVRADQMRTEADLEVQFMEDVLAILGPERTFQLIEAERKFKREVMQRIQDKRRGGGPGGRPNR